MAGDQDIRNELHTVKIDVIADRSGQILRNYLIDTMTAKGTVKPAKYRLKVQMTETKRKTGFRRDSTARHVELIITSNMKLVDVVADKVVLEDKIRQVTSYSFGSEAEQGSFSANVSEQTSRERALKILADNIKLRIASFMMKQRLKDEA